MMPIRSAVRSISESTWDDRKTSTAAVALAADDLAHLADAVRVEAGHRLIEDQDRRVVQQRPREAELLLQPLRQVDGEVIGAIGEPTVSSTGDPPMGTVDP